jgi:hypothetical protein
LTAEPSCKDEARIGQQGTLTRIWARRGTRPRAPRDQRYEWVYIFGAVCPQRRATAALVVPTANTEVMSLHLAEIGRQVTPGSHATLVLDGAGYHVAKDLDVPENMTLVNLPPYAPELNPIENVWEYLRGNKLAITVFDSPHGEPVEPRRHPRQGLPGLDILRRRPRPHRIHHHAILGNGHSLRPLV